ncbi:hypothetical protein Hanom_Chr08g00706961 [Helianthus anomalus]
MTSDKHTIQSTRALSTPTSIIMLVVLWWSLVLSNQDLIGVVMESTKFAIMIIIIIILFINKY